ncbi:fibronectin type III domain-containing protein [Nocardioides nanhaiensis]
MHLRLVAYTPLGAQIGVLPDSLNYTATIPFGADLPTLKVGYTKAGRRSDVLEALPEIAVERWDAAAGTWVEPDDARFLVVKRAWNSKDDGGQARSYDAIHLGWLARKARVWTGGNMNSEGKRQFNAANPGTIVGTIFDDARGRGWGPGLARSFNATTDSAGQPWAHEVTLAFEPSADLDSVLKAVVDQGLAELSWTGRTLNLYNPDTALARDLTTGTAPVWVRHTDGVTSAPEEGSIEDLVTFARLTGDAGGVWDVSNPAAVQTYGRLEGYVTQSGVTDEGTAALLIEQELAAGASERTQYTREWHAAAATVVPWQHYRPGDWAFFDREDNGTLIRDRARVAQVSVTYDAEGVSGHTTLGTRLDDLLARLARRTANVTGGASSGGAGGTPSPPTPDGPDSRAPAAVDGLVVSTTAYADTDGQPRARVALDWADVTTDAEGVLLGVRGYEVWQRGPDGTWTLAATVTDSQHAVSPLPTNTAHTFRVRAVSDNYVTGPWSTERTITTARYLAPPPRPSAPGVTVRLGVVTVAWDGRTSTGATMPATLAHVRVLVDGVIRDRLDGPDARAVITGLTYNMAASITLVAVDRAGNVSTASAAVAATPRPLVNGDLGAGSVTVLTLATNSVTADAIAGGAIDGIVITGTTVRTAASGQRVELDARGLSAYPSSGAARTTISAATGRLTAVDADINGTVTAGNASGNRVRLGEDLSYGGGVLDFLRSNGSLMGQLSSWEPGGVRLAGANRTIMAVDEGNGGTAIWLDLTTPGYGMNLISEDGLMVGISGGAAVLDAPLFRFQGGALDITREVVNARPSGGMTFNPGGQFLLTPSVHALIYAGGVFQVRTGGANSNSIDADGNGNVYFRRHSTNSGSANVQMGAGGQIFRITSRRDSKLLIEPIPTERLMRLLDVPMVSWFDRVAAETLAAELAGEDDVPENQTPMLRIPGLVAEDVEATGLTEFVIYDQDGDTQGLAYDRIGVALIPLVRDLYARVASLEERNA